MNKPRKNASDIAIELAGGDPWFALRLAVVLQAAQDEERVSMLNYFPNRKSRDYERQVEAQRAGIQDCARSFLGDLRKSFLDTQSGGYGFNARRMDYHT